MRKINTFWNWFQDNNQTIKNFINETPKSQKQLDYMIIFPKKPTEKTELIITANGNPEYFDQVIQLINNAPVLRNWRFIAFIQLTEKIDKIIERLDDPYVIQELTIKTNEVKFLPLDYDINSKELDIIIYLKNYYIHCNTKTLQQIIYVILKDLLGEKSIYRKINFIQLAKIPNEIDELIKLYEFQYYIYEIN
ncbi:hypothetical protein [Flavobacterium sp.]|uniref:hypothetical protein n=1 Tax=Flavobacterium sp. TaxID=239 RepID=UPI004047587D